jgi:hypothetical protein
LSAGHSVSFALFSAAEIRPGREPLAGRVGNFRCQARQKKPDEQGENSASARFLAIHAK